MLRRIAVISVLTVCACNVDAAGGRDDTPVLADDVSPIPSAGPTASGSNGDTSGTGSSRPNDGVSARDGGNAGTGASPTPKGAPVDGSARDGGNADNADMGPSPMADGGRSDVPEGGTPASPPFDPAQVPGLVVWLTADRGVNVGPNGAVTTWVDRASGLVANVRSPCAAPRPASSAVAAAPRPMVSLGNGACMHISTPTPVAFRGFTILAATEIDATAPTGEGRLVSLYGAGAYVDLMRFGERARTTANLSLRQGFTLTTAAGDRTFAPSQMQVVSVFSPTAQERGDLRVDGEVRASQAALPQPLEYPFSTIRIGGGNLPGNPALDSFFGKLGELLVFNRRLTAPELAAAERYLMARFPKSGATR